MKNLKMGQAVNLFPKKAVFKINEYKILCFIFQLHSHRFAKLFSRVQNFALRPKYA